ncbi:MAG: tetratricopeptide repeat protein [Treponema sp.]|nr:tetratricopeptide repeat protein [Treponema sp.]
MKIDVPFRRVIIFLITVFLLVLVFSGCKGKAAVRKQKAVTIDKNLSPEAEDLVRTGIGYHDRGDYKTAIDYYNRAMKLSPGHPVIYYEMGFSSLYMDDSKTALDLAEKGIANAKALDYNELIPTLLDLKGSALDNLGRRNEAIEVYLQAINEYGAANTLLYYNLGLSYYRSDRREEAAEAISKGLVINPNHPSSNYLLGRIYMEGGMKTQAFYALCYFLLLEPYTDRAAQSYKTVVYMLSSRDETGYRNNGTFTPADTVISTAYTLDETNSRLEDKEKTQAKLRYVFTTLEEQKNSRRINRSEGDELWWDFYSPFFYRIAGSRHFDTFCRYIGLSADPNADNWIENGRDEIEGFFEWLNLY